MQWGEVRITNNIYLAMLCGFRNEEELVDLLLLEFYSRVNDSRNFALLNSIDNIPLEITRTGLDFEELMIQRSAKTYIP